MVLEQETLDQLKEINLKLGLLVGASTMDEIAKNQTKQDEVSLEKLKNK